MSATTIKRRSLDIAPLSVQQKNVWINHEVYPESTAHNMVSCLRLTGCLNLEAFRKSLYEIIRRHEILRTTFSVVESEPRQVIHQNIEMPFVEIDCRQFSSEEQQLRFEQAVDRERQSLFDLQQGPLLRFVLLRMNENEHIFLMTVHHIVMDGWSLRLFSTELTVAYESFCNGKPPSLPEINVQYSDYASWQNEEYNRLNRGNSYWKEIFENASFVEFPSDHPRVFGRKGESATRSINISSDLCERIKSFSKEERTTPFVTLLAALQILLYKYTERENMLLGYLNAGRSNSEILGLLGHFSNLGIVKTKLSDSLTFRDVVKVARTSVLDSYGNLIISNREESVYGGEISLKKTFFPVVMNFQNFPTGQWKLQNLNIKPELIATDEAGFDMEFMIYPTNNELMIIAQYRKDLYSENTVKHILENYKTVLQFTMDSADSSIQEIPITIPVETHYAGENTEKTERADEYIYNTDQKYSLSEPSYIESLLMGIWKEVLEIDDLAIDDNYVDIGGESLSALMIISRIKTNIKVVITMREFLDNLTVRHLAKLVEDRIKHATSEPSDKIIIIDRNDDVPLSFFQEARLMYELSLDVNNVTYLHSSSWFSIRLHGSLDRKALENAFNYMINRHEIFRTSYWPVFGSVSPATDKWDTVCQSCRMNPGQFLPKVKFKQSIHPSAIMNFDYTDISEYGDEDKNIEINIIADEVIQKRYRYESPPLTRAALVRIAESEHMLIVAAAHLIADMFSIRIYEKELAYVYSTLVNEQPINLPDIETQYADYSAWMKRRLETGSFDSAKSYWKEQFDGYTPTDVTILPFTDIEGSENDTDFGIEAKYYHHPISDELSSAIRKYAGSVNMTVFNIVMTGFILCLHGESGKNDIGVYTFFANRVRPETESIIGMFAIGNTIRIKINADDSLYQCLSNVSETMDCALRNQEFMLPPPDLRVRKTLYDLVVYRPITCELLTVDENASFYGLDVERAVVGRSKSEYALRSFVIDFGKKLSLMFQYNLDLFDSSDIRRMAARMERIIKEIITNPFAAISSVDFDVDI